MGPSAQQQAARKVTKMCMIVTTTFTIAWLPFQLDRIVLQYGNVSDAVLILDTVETLTYVNSCLNPIIYALMWRPFRRSLIEVSLSCVFMPHQIHEKQTIAYDVHVAWYVSVSLSVCLSVTHPRLAHTVERIEVLCLGWRFLGAQGTLY